MRKKLNFEFLLIILMIIFILFETKTWWLPFIKKIKDFLSLVSTSFAISYVIYPIYRYFKIKFKSKTSAYLITIIILGFSIFLIVVLTYPILKKELFYLSELIFDFLKQLLTKRISFGVFTSSIYGWIYKRLDIINEFIYKNAFSLVTSVITIFSKVGLVLVFSLLFLWHMDKIRNYIDKILKRKNQDRVLKNIDIKMRDYIKSIAIISLIETIEYTVLYFLIGHPNYLLLGFLAGITTFIPYLGALFTNFLAIITALKLSKTTFILTVVILIIVPILNNYLVDPKVYHKTIKLSPVLVIIATILFGYLFSILGSILAIPVLIILMELYQEYLYKDKKP